MRSRIAKLEERARGKTVPQRFVWVDLEAAEAAPEDFNGFLRRCIHHGLVVLSIRAVDKRGRYWRADNDVPKGAVTRTVAGRTFWQLPNTFAKGVELHFPNGFDRLLGQDFFREVAAEFTPEGA